ncbi:proteasome regulatory particle base subunit [Coemansia spiralis]|uniref:Ribophorin II n=2 Tax=Coemansia TaxID=4863 RepID=A0A9W8L188_9FUNG|nr:Dolichyl-diphosphooligosaccharide--protein glycosyltransferase subunit Swp1 [Coemansia spiralis]KAJ1995904.1 proteasome regulatory particle base subunit [Coemansia umbellata]KAJ2625794.1 proteasome regulatory particle base subunit [Coemansia sp. RSA 1358]KAJ2680917.1 proteasome regulatory particle base subunit [Coemansia spiralis]
MKLYSLIGNLWAGSGALCLFALLLCISAVHGELVAENINVKVMERTGDKLFEKMLKHQESLKGVPKITATTPLSVSFDVVNADKKAIDLDQAFVSFRNTNTGEEIAFVAKKAKRGSYKMDLSRKNFRTHFSSAPGSYDIALVLGSFTDGGLFYKLGDIEIGGNSAAAKRKQQQKMDAAYGPKPEIRHRFAEPQRMPSALVSLAFTAAVVALLVALFCVWSRLGVNAANLKKESTGSVVFMALITAYMGLAIAYWVGVKLFPTLAYTLALALPTYLAGQYALSRRMQSGIRS